MAKNHLDNLTIHKFRGLRDLELKDLGQVNLLVGENNCGKTSVLESINIYSNPVDIKEWITTANQRELKSRLSSIESLKWLFPHNQNQEEMVLYQGEIKIGGSGNFIVKYLNAFYSEIEEIWPSQSSQRQPSLFDDEDEEILDKETLDLHRGIEISTQLNIQQFSTSKETVLSPIKIQLWEDQPLRLNSLNHEKFSLRTSIVTTSSHRFSPNQLILFSNARFHDLKSKILILLSQFDSGIKDIEILYPQGNSARRNPNLYIHHTSLGIVPISIFGDGVRRIFHIALQASRAINGILLIDEIESTIHTELLHYTFQWIVNCAREFNVQVFATTHSLEAVDAMIDAADSASDLVLYRLEPTETKTRVVRHDWERLKRLRENLGQEVRW